MKGDFSRLTFRPEQQYSAVLSQQGRVQLDADVNEQAMIGLNLTRTVVADVIGQHGAPGDGFTIGYTPETSSALADLTIVRGRYYVDGVLADSTAPPAYAPVGGNLPPEVDLTYWDQPFAFRDQDKDKLPALPFLAYLAVSEQLVTAVQDPVLQEQALGALQPDTTARSRVVWKVLPLKLNLGDGQQPASAFADWVTTQQGLGGLLAARTEQPASIEEDPCIISPDAAYRGPENQLYRVEIHDGGPAGQATFVWSRDNGSVVFPIVSLTGQWVTLTTLGRDGKQAVEVGDRVEVVDDAYTGRGEPKPLHQVIAVDLPGSRVQLDSAPDGSTGQLAALHPLLRRWDQQTPASSDVPQLQGGAVPVTEGAWLDLEDGVQVWFEPGSTYVTGGYWLIPARTLSADVEWPQDGSGTPLLLPPAGVPVHYAPLAWVEAASVTSLRHTFTPLAH